MSGGWDAYLNLLKKPDKNGQQHVEWAAIWGIEGDASVWATDEELKGITVEEVKRLAGDSASFYQNNPKIMGEKFMLLQDNRKEKDTLCMVLKKKGKGGMCIGQSSKAMVICHCPEGKNVASASLNVHEVVSYLDKAGY